MYGWIDRKIARYIDRYKVRYNVAVIGLNVNITQFLIFFLFFCLTNLQSVPSYRQHNDNSATTLREICNFLKTFLFIWLFIEIFQNC